MDDIDGDETSRREDLEGREIILIVEEGNKGNTFDDLREREI